MGSQPGPSPTHQPTRLFENPSFFRPVRARLRRDTSSEIPPENPSFFRPARGSERAFGATPPQKYRLKIAINLQTKKSTESHIKLQCRLIEATCRLISTYKWPSTYLRQRSADQAGGSSPPTHGTHIHGSFENNWDVYFMCSSSYPTNERANGPE